MLASSRALVPGLNGPPGAGPFVTLRRVRSWRFGEPGGLCLSRVLFLPAHRECVGYPASSAALIAAICPTPANRLAICSPVSFAKSEAVACTSMEIDTTAASRDVVGAGAVAGGTAVCTNGSAVIASLGLLVDGVDVVGASVV